MYKLLDIPSPTKKPQENGGDALTLNFFNALHCAPNNIAGTIAPPMQADRNTWAQSYKRLQNEGVIAQQYADLAARQLGYTVPGLYQGNIVTQTQLQSNPDTTNTTQATAPHPLTPVSDLIATIFGGSK